MISRKTSVWPRPRGRWYLYHLVAWDDMCGIAFPALHRLLVGYAEQNIQVGETEIERLTTTYPSQRMAVLRARAILLARQVGQVTDLTQLNGIVARLPEGEKGFLRQSSQVRQWVSEISRLQTRLSTIDRNSRLESENKRLLERALDHAIVRGHNVLYELMHRESFLPGEWEYLSAFRIREEQSPPEDEKLRASLRHRQLVEEHSGMWHLRIPLMARWLVRRA
jgi:hypothetical protein